MVSLVPGLCGQVANDPKAYGREPAPNSSGTMSRRCPRVI